MLHDAKAVPRREELRLNGSHLAAHDRYCMRHFCRMMDRRDLTRTLLERCPANGGAGLVLRSGGVWRVILPGRREAVRIRYRDRMRPAMLEVLQSGVQ
jgi:hypothetical protein